MSRKGVDKGIGLISSIKNLPSKFSPSAPEGSRIAPPRSQDHLCDLQIDAGRYNPSTKNFNVVLQVNSQPQSPGLKEWIQKHSTHAKLATAEYDTTAADQVKEAQRVVEELRKKAKENL
ncbi:hypothetical protein AAFC00_005039 [Neodothiora populina]|uniref:Uncharacterized protein n=1 Tax=Neodothiora populina TaxID=2781224 RepID=A0ABR3P407_9PEZI